MLLPDGPTAPHLAVLTLRFQVYGCDDQKAKARAFLRMKTVWGKAPDLAVAEVADLDSLEYATWSVVAVGPSAARLQQRLQAVELEIADQIDAPILDTFYERVGG